ncbi:MAG TPA: hypothetical protein VHL79_09300 [Ramlibacter sp.]|jgi:hypothetical protein|nr:hypothetical protein [Ramlibacter sp.]
MGNEQRIERWSVLAGGQLAGEVHNRPRHHDGARIITSPVVEVRIMGTGAWPSRHPTAFTESGTSYKLGNPADSFGAAKAKAFIAAKLASGSAQRSAEGTRGFDPNATVVHAAVDTSLQHFERIDMYESSFKPLEET